MNFKLLFITLLIIITAKVECAKILAVFPFPSKSHHILGSSLLKALAKRGHQVTMISPFPLEKPFTNYEDITVEDLLQFKEDSNMGQVVQQQNVSFFTKWSNMMTIVNDINERFLNHTSVRNLIISKRKFDAVISLYFGNDAYLALPYLFEGYSIAFSTIGCSSMINQLTGNSAPYSYVPNIFPAFPAEMTFLQRVMNTITLVGTELYSNLYMIPEQERLIQKYFPEVPSMQELRDDVSLVLLNSHYSIESPRPYVPNMIQVGGLHVEEPRELKGDLKEFMDSAAEGVVFFSFGSNVKSSELPKDKLNAIIACFTKLRIKVLWKFETDSNIKLPPNVKIGKWLPQRDILAHPNIKLFVTHGGLLSTTEAIYHGVPMVGIPFFGDQEANVADGEINGYLVKLSFLELSEETLTKAINEVLSNPKYRETVKLRSSVLRDQPLKPIDKAVFWVEYVLRHKGAHHLKTSAIKLKWYQYYLLDVLSFILGIIFVLLATLYFILRAILKFLKKIFAKNDSSKNMLKTKKTKLA